MTTHTEFELNYHTDLSNYYRRLATLPGFVLLESSDKTQGRYDILSAYPYEDFKIEESDLCLNSAFKELQELIPIEHSVNQLPFQGGAIGYLSYDLGTRLRNIHSPVQSSLIGMPLLHVGLYDWAIITDHLLKKTVLFSANTKSETSLIVEEILTRWNAENSINESFHLLNPFTPLISKEDYGEAFESIYQNLEMGRCYQVNFTQPFNACYQGNAWEIYQRIRTKNPVPYTAFLGWDEGKILSFSPERFLLQEGCSLLTSPIKGTIKRSDNFLEDKQLGQNLQGSDKNQAENIMIVDLLRNDLGKIAQTGSVQVKSLCEIQSFRGVHHLVSHIEALRSPNVSSFEAFEACFPGGSITGAPKLESMRVIAEHELYARSVYCGNILYFSRHGRFDSNIAIRTIIARNGILHLSAGGGIVIDSEWEDEYCECLTKIAAITNALN